MAITRGVPEFGMRNGSVRRNDRDECLRSDVR